jgi:hypothetical protein
MEQTGPTNDPFKGFPFPSGTTPLQRHLYAGVKNICSGAFVHRKAAIQLIWQKAGIVWHPWIDRALQSFCSYNWVTWTGPAASAKSFNASLIGLLFWLEFPEGTSVIMASTTRDALARRLWYYIQDLHSKIRPRPDLTIGQALYSEYMIRLRAGDKKNGIFGLAIEDGPVEEALHNLIGYHNTRVLLVVDEAQGTREAIFQATDNLAKNPEFKCPLLGNAESREDPHGRFSEPLGGWISAHAPCYRKASAGSLTAPLASHQLVTLSCHVLSAYLFSTTIPPPDSRRSSACSPHCSVTDPTREIRFFCHPILQWCIESGKSAFLNSLPRRKPPKLAGGFTN